MNSRPLQSVKFFLIFTAALFMLVFGYRQIRNAKATPDTPVPAVLPANSPADSLPTPPITGSPLYTRYVAGDLP